MKLFFIRRDTTHRCADGSKQRIGELRKDRTLTGGGSLLVKLEHNNDNLLNILSLLACLRGHLPHTPDRHHRTIIVRTSMFRTTWRQKVTFVPRKTGICRHTQGRVKGSSFSHSIDWCDHVCCNPAGDGEKKKKKSIKCVLRQQQHEVRLPHRSKTVPGSLKISFTRRLGRKLEHDKWAAMHVRVERERSADEINVSRLNSRILFTPDRYQPMSLKFYLYFILFWLVSSFIRRCRRHRFSSLIRARFLLVFLSFLVKIPLIEISIGGEKGDDSSRIFVAS